ncbi:DUF1232 domain-containing protein [Halomonas janggokensis]|uniref:YkvA family protein n=1 Tax=Halomonadaceae TaxID=28256 RepID=UPI0007FB8BCB|nr:MULTISPECIES: DUF1232 domain-containing protein [Halomonas]MCZ0930512.1 DUF1232 domain-containing protein [Halomonas janggokensis]OAZ94790.1 hypothetical protein ADS46_18085 [Halomonas sp. G11]
MIRSVEKWARIIKRDVHVVWLAARDSRTPCFARALAMAVAAYAVSPIDLIPDFIPVLGYLDDLIILPLGILIVVRLIPPKVLDEHREAVAKSSNRPVSRFAAGVVISIWVGFAALLGGAFL